MPEIKIKMNLFIYRNQDYTNLGKMNVLLKKVKVKRIGRYKTLFLTYFYLN